MRTAKKMGVKSVAVYSEADKNSMHVAMVKYIHYVCDWFCKRFCMELTFIQNGSSPSFSHLSPFMKKGSDLNCCMLGVWLTIKWAEKFEVKTAFYCLINDLCHIYFFCNRQMKHIALVLHPHSRVTWPWRKS